jgi:hypothetical protein
VIPEVLAVVPDVGRHVGIGQLPRREVADDVAAAVVLGRRDA